VTSINILDLYDRFGNFFEIDCQGGTIYLIGDEVDETIDETTVIRYAGKFLSYKPYENVNKVEPNLEILQRFVRRHFELNLTAKGYKLRKWYCAYKTEDEVKQPHHDIFSVFNGFVYRISIFEEKLLLCIDPHIILQTNCSIHDLVMKGIPAHELNSFPVRYATTEKIGVDGYLIDTFKGPNEGLVCKIKRYRQVADKPLEEIISAEKVYPESRPELIQRFIVRLGSSYDVIDLQRRLSWLDSKTASKDRFLATLDIVATLSKEVFPIKFGDFVVNVKTQPIIVKL